MGKTLRHRKYITAFLFCGLLLLWMAAKHSYAQNSQQEQRNEPILSFAQPERTVSEDAGEIQIEVTLSRSLDRSLEVWVELQTGLGNAGRDDFQGPVSQSLRFQPGDEKGSVRTVHLRLDDDEIFEGKEVAVFRMEDRGGNSAPAISAYDSLRLTIADNDSPGVVFNEILLGSERADGKGLTFLELLNNEEEKVDLGGWSVNTENGSAYRFSEGTILPGGGGLVLLLAGELRRNPPGAFILRSPELELDAEADVVSLLDGEGQVIDRYTYRDMLPSVSRVRQPEGTGPFVIHSRAEGADGRVHSAALRADGSYFQHAKTLQGAPGWRMLSSPYRGLTVSFLEEFFPLRTDVGNEPLQSARLYSGFDGQRFTEPGGGDMPLPPGHAFLAWFGRPESTVSPPHRSLRVQNIEGAAGNVSISLHGNGEGWNMVGNPFRVPLNTSEISEWVRGGDLESTVVQYWNGRENTWVVGTLTSGAVEAWQGFVIHNRDASTLEVPEPAGSRNVSFDASSEARMLSFRLNGTSAEGFETNDRAAVLVFEDGASHGWDQRDALKLQPLSSRYAQLNILGSRDGERVAKAQDSRPLDLERSLTLPMNLVTRQTSGSLELMWDRKNIPGSWDLTLTDRIADRQVNLNAADTYTFAMSDAPPPAADGDMSQEPLPPRLESASTEPDGTARFTLTIDPGETELENAESDTESVRLLPNYPNPFTESTTIHFELSEEKEVTLSIWNILGQRMEILVDRVMDAGPHRMIWNPGNLPAGLYIVKLEVDGRLYHRRITLIK